MLVAYLTLIPTVLNAVISQSPLSVGIFSFNLILVLIGTWVMYRKFEEERLMDFTRKLNIFVKELEEKIINPAYIYSLPCIALEIARDSRVLGNTQAWDKLVTKLSEDLTNNTIALDKRTEGNGKQFRAHLNDFRGTLISLQEFKRRFYEMITEACSLPSLPNLVVFWDSPEFKRRYERISEGYNKYMDKLEIFFDEVKAEFEESFDENLTEHVKEFDELFPKVQRIRL
jgi:hypothetical protein